MSDSLGSPVQVTPSPTRPEWRMRGAARERRRSRSIELGLSDLVLPHRLGRYTLFAHIGRGGMADIYLAQTEAGLAGVRLVVIKQILPSLARSAEFVDMLVAEAKLAARLNHANIAKVEDLGRDGDSVFIAMEYVEGLDMREMLRRCARENIALPVEFSLRIVTEVLRALDYAHRASTDDGKPLGLVHRDVTPSNVLLSFEGEIKLCDFGIARANSLTHKAADEVIVGKAGYMSPEQARGDVLDARADVFSVGIMLWEALSGRRLYRASEGERLLDIARAAEIPPLPERGLPREAELVAIVNRALARDREDRYPSAAAMLQDLEDYTTKTRMTASPIRYSEWITASFGREIIRDRRARQRVMRALSLGPPAVIRPIGLVPIPDADVTPSAFPVALRADYLSHDACSEEDKSEDLPITKMPPVVPEPAPKKELARPVRVSSAVAPKERGFDMRLLMVAFMFVGALCVALRLAVGP